MIYKFTQTVTQIFGFTTLLIMSCLLQGQTCPTEGVMVETQLEIDNFQLSYSSCDTIFGNLSIGILNPTEITSLNGFSSIHHVTGDLRIFNNPNLSNLIGLNSIASIGGSLFIDQNNFSLSSLEGLNNLETVGKEVIISNNGGLLSLNGLDKLVTIDSNLTISANGILDDLSGLETLRLIDGFLRISGNNNITSLSGIDDLGHTTISDLRLLSNPNLSICGVRSICEYLAIASNTLVISSNRMGCETRVEIEASCPLLPVTYLSFQGRAERNTVHLTWKTSTEVDNKGFEVERSINGQDWESIGFVPHLNTIDETKSYNYHDRFPLTGRNFYRLKQIDQDERYSFSRIVSIQYKKYRQLKVFPNPSSGWLYINDYQDIEELKIISVSGDVSINLKPSSNRIDISSLPSGLYFASIQVNTNHQVVKFYKSD